VIDLHWEILRTLACPGIIVSRIALALSEPTPTEDVIVPLSDLMAAGLAERFWDRGKYRYRLTDLGQAVYVRLLRRDHQQFVIEARMQVRAFVRACPVHAVQPAPRSVTMPEYAAPTTYAEFVTRYPRVIAQWAIVHGRSEEAAHAYLSVTPWPDFLTSYPEHLILKWVRLRLLTKLGMDEPVNPSARWLADHELIRNWKVA
jgi:hypothetical protein